MGTYSFYVTSRNNAKDCKIDWSKMSTDIIFQSRVLQRCYNKSETLEDVAKEFDESKLFGYLTPALIEALIEFNLHLQPNGCHPRIYFDYEGDDIAMGLEFVPGTTVLNILRYDYRHLLSTYNNTKAIVHSTPERAGWVVEQL